MRLKTPPGALVALRQRFYLPHFSRMHLLSAFFGYNECLGQNLEKMQTQFENALLIHNPNAGNGGDGRRRLLDEARRILSSNGIEAELAETAGPGHATEIAQQATRDGRQLVIACGGDGTLNEVVNGLAAHQNGHRVPLALLPGGTANILAKELDLPWDIPRAAKRLVNGEVREIALGLATPLENPEKQRYFLSVAGAGPDGMIVYSIDLGLKARVGILAYWWQGAREVLRYTYPRFRVRTGGRQMEVTLAIVGRTKNYGGPFKITDQADLFEDQFEVMALTTQSGLRYLSYLPTLWMGNLRKEEDVYFWKAETLVCEPLEASPVHAQVDGESLARLPMEFSIVPRALKLLVPSGTASSNGGSAKP
jgi:diacylglycerol kinase (ATP)